MAGAPPPMQFMPLQYAQGGGDLASQLKALGQAAGPLAKAAGSAMTPAAVAPGSAVPGDVGPSSVGGPNGPAPLVPPGTTPMANPMPGQPGSPQAGPVAPGGSMPLPGMPGTAAAGPAAPQPPAQSGILAALQGLQPPQIMDILRKMSSQGQSVIPATQPGSAALQGAGLLPGG